MAIFVKLQRKYMRITIITLHLKCNDFDIELEIMYARMYIQLVQVLIPILDFCFYFQSWKIHNMLAITLDLWFKGLQCLIEKWEKKLIVGEYEKIVLKQLLLHVSKHFDFKKENTSSIGYNYDESLFGASFLLKKWVKCCSFFNYLYFFNLCFLKMCILSPYGKTMKENFHMLGFLQYKFWPFQAHRLKWNTSLVLLKF